MTVQELGTIVLVIAIVVWLGVRQTTWRAISPSRVWRMPAIVGLIGVGELVTSKPPIRLDSAELGMLLIELVLGAGVGAAIGVFAHLRPVSQASLDAHAARAAARGNPVHEGAPEFETRNGVLGLVLWFALMAARVGLVFGAQSLGVHTIQSSGVILLMLAVNRLARSAVILSRAQRVLAGPAGA